MLAPVINFTEYTIIASFLGSKPTSGYSIEIKGILEIDVLVIINVGEKYPRSGSVQFQIVTPPFHIIKTEKITKPIIFKHDILDPLNYVGSLIIIFSICGICGMVFYIKYRKNTLR